MKDLNRLSKFIEEQSEKIGDYAISFSLHNGDELKISRDAALKNSLKRTPEGKIDVDIFIEKDGLQLKKTVRVGELFLETNNGYRNKGVDYKFVTTSGKLDGFSDNESVIKKTEGLTGDGYKVTKEYSRNTLNFKVGYKTISITEKDTGIYIKVLDKLTRAMPLLDFMYAIFGINPVDIKDYVGDFPELRRLVARDKGKRIKIQEFDYYKKESKVIIASEPRESILKEVSFSSRCEGLKLSRRVMDYPKGTFLTKSILNEIDDSDIFEIYTVNKLREVKFIRSKMETQLEIYASVINLFFTKLEYGFVNKESRLQDNVYYDYPSVIMDKIGNNLRIYKETIKGYSNMSKDNVVSFNEIAKSMSSKEFNSNIKAGVLKKTQLQTFDNTNVFERCVAAGEITVRVGRDVSNVHKSERNILSDQICRIDPVQTAESKKVGLNVHKTLGTKTENLNFKAPYRNLKTGQIDYNLPIVDENYIALANQSGAYPGKYQCRLGLNLEQVDKDKVVYQELNTTQYTSIATAAIPFLECNYGKRILMGANMAVQAMTPVRNDMPIVGTVANCLVGKELRTSRDIINSSQSDYVAGKPLILESVKIENKIKKVIFSYCGDQIIEIVKHDKTIGKSLEKTLVNGQGPWYDEDVVLYPHGVKLADDREISMESESFQLLQEDYSEKGRVSVGTNLKVLFAMKKYTFEDGIVVSARLNKEHKTKFIHLEELKYEVDISSKEDTVKESIGDWGKFPDYITKSGMPKLGTRLNGGDVAAILTVKGKPEAFRVKNSVKGVVVSVDEVVTQYVRKISIVIARERLLELGDKLAGRHGNKGVVSHFMEEWELPYNNKGETPDIILNPLGLPSRMNIGQLFEVILGECGYRLGENYLLEAFNRDNFKLLEDKMKEAGFSEQTFYNPKTLLPYDRPMTMGVMYMYRLKHLSDYNFSAVGYPTKRNEVTNQPLQKTVEGGAQRLGEMGSWALMAHGSINILNELFSSHSDNWEKAKELNLALKNDTEYSQGSEDVPTSILNLRASLLMMGINLQVSNGEVSMLALTDEDIIKQSLGEVNKYNYNSVEYFGGDKKSKTFEQRSKIAHVDLGVEIAHPLGCETVHNLLTRLKKEKRIKVTQGNIKQILISKLWVHKDVSKGLIFIEKRDLKSYTRNERDTNILTGQDAMIFILKNYDIGITMKWLDNAKKGESENTYDKRYNAVKRFMDTRQLSDLVMTKWPIISTSYRKISKMDRRKTMETSAIEELVTSLGNRASILSTLNKMLSIPKDDQKKTFMKNMKKYKKHSNLRDTMLGKVVGWSGRSVIVPDYKLNYDQIGMPKLMSIHIYENKLFNIKKELDVLEEIKDLRTLKRFLTYCVEGELIKIKEEFKINNPIQISDMMFIELQKYLDSKWTLAGRQPILHQFSIRSFHIKLVKGLAIHLHPLSCTGYNADFDGDQMFLMAIFSKEAEAEAEGMSLSGKIINPKDSQSIIEPSQDMIAGFYWLTMNKDNSLESSKEVPNLYQHISLVERDLKQGIIKPYTMIRVSNEFEGTYTSTAGRLIFNSIVQGLQGDKVKYDTLITKTEVKKIVRAVYETNTKTGAMKIYQRMMETGLEYSDISGLSFNYSDIEDKYSEVRVPLIKEGQRKIDSLQELTTLGFLTNKQVLEEESRIWDDVKGRVSKEIYNKVDRNSNLFIYIDSGARGSKSDFNSILGFIGQVQDTLGTILREPVRSNYSTGLSAFEYFINSYGSRAGLISSSTGTADEGYKNRQLVYTIDLETVEEDCGSEGRDLELSYVLKEEIKDKLMFRVVDKDDKFYNLSKVSLGLDNSVLMDTIKYFNHYKPDTVKVDGELVNLEYKLDKYSRSILLDRVSTDDRIDHEIITTKDINRIEKEGWSTVKIRDMMSCKSKGGLCQKCYGKSFDTGEYPELHKPLGFKEAQAISEVSTQAALNKINSSAIEAESDNVVIDIKSIVQNVSDGTDSKLVETGGTVKVTDNSVVINNDDGSQDYYLINNSPIVDGQRVERGDYLENGIPNFNKYYKYTKDLVKTRELIAKFYQKASERDNIQARSFEILAVAQTSKGYKKYGKSYEVVDIEYADVPVVLGAKQINYTDALRNVAFEGVVEALNYNAISGRTSKLKGFLSKSLMGTNIANKEWTDYNFKEKAPMIVKSRVNLEDTEQRDISDNSTSVFNIKKPSEIEVSNIIPGLSLDLEDDDNLLDLEDLDLDIGVTNVTEEESEDSSEELIEDLDIFGDSSTNEFEQEGDEDETDI